MATRKIQVRLAVSFQELVQADSGQPFKQPVNEHFSNECQPSFPLGSTQDTGSTTTVLPAASGVTPSSFTVNLAQVAPTALDYLFATFDGPLSVKVGSTDIVPCQSVFVKDGPLPAGVTSVTFYNYGASPVNLTYCATGH